MKLTDLKTSEEALSFIGSKRLFVSDYGLKELDPSEVELFLNRDMEGFALRLIDGGKVYVQAYTTEEETRLDIVRREKTAAWEATEKHRASMEAMKARYEELERTERELTEIIKNRKATQ